MHKDMSHLQNHFSSHLSSRVHEDVYHTLTNEQLEAKPELVARILFFVLPFLFLVISSLFLLSRNLRIHQNNFIKTFPKRWYIYIIMFIALVGLATIGIQAVIQNAWSVKLWIFFASLCVFFTVFEFIYTIDTHASIVLSTLVVLITAVGNQWAFIQLMGLSENTQGEIGWKHVDRNIVGFIEASLIIIFYIHFCESLQYACKAHSKTVGIVFWTLTPLTIIGILVLNILKFGPLLDSIGYIVAAVILFIGSLDSYFFYNEEEDRKHII